MSDLSLLVNSPADVEVIGSLKTDPRFAIPITLSEDMHSGTPTGVMVRVAGMVRSYEPGKWVTLWDATGQIMIQSKQSQSLRFGDQVEAIGYPDLESVQQCLRDGLYRLIDLTNPAAAASLMVTNALPCASPHNGT